MVKSDRQTERGGGLSGGVEGVRVGQEDKSNRNGTERDKETEWESCINEEG